MSSDELNNKASQDLFKAVLSLKTPLECKKFFRDVCTLSELKAMTERLQVAKLIQKNIPYREISKKTSASTTTITRVAHWYNHGKGGYKMILDRM